MNPPTIWVLIFLGAAGLLFGLRRRAPVRLSTAMVLALLVTVACGGGRSSPPPPPPPPGGGTGTPPGSYTVNVSANSGVIRRSLSVSLTVQ